MHILDGILEPRVWGPLIGAGAVAVGVAERSIRWEEHEHKIPLMGVLGAFVFAAQLFNFPLLGIASGHLVGGALLAILVGPAAGILVMTCVLIVQCLLLSDGGLLALGANVVNLAVIAPLAGGVVYGLVRRAPTGARGGPPIALAAFLAGWTSVVLPALAAGVELAASGRIPWGPGIALLLFWHALIGIPEGLVTVGLVQFLRRARPDVVPGMHGHGPSPSSAAVASPPEEART